jgi:hypothetical protein
MAMLLPCCTLPLKWPRALTHRSRAQWAGQLGDGRAINLGAAVGLDGQAWELQLKVSAAACVSRFI